MLSNNKSIEIDGKAERRIYIDFLKVIAIYMVLFNHTETNGFMLFTIARTSKLYWFYLFNSISIKMAVPLFFMASGALLLPKEESYKELIRKRVLRFVVVLVVASVIMYLYSCFRLNEQQFSVGIFVKTLYSSQTTISLWFLYSYLAFLITLPILRKLTKAMTRIDYKWIIAVYGTISCLSIFEYLVWKGSAVLNENISFFFMSIFVFYPMIGYYIDRVLEKTDFTVKRLILMIFASVVAIIVCCFMTNYKCSLTGDWSEASCQTFFDTLIFLPSITVFYGAKLLFLRYKPSNKLQKVIRLASGTILGIFLIERICRQETKPIFLFLKPYLHSLPACWIWILCACIIGGCVVLIIKRLPYIGDYI